MKYKKFKFHLNQLEVIEYEFIQNSFRILRKIGFSQDCIVDVFFGEFGKVEQEFFISKNSKEMEYYLYNDLSLTEIIVEFDQFGDILKFIKKYENY